MPPPAAGAYGLELELALHLARRAGDLLRAFYDVPPVVGWKEGQEPVTDADRAANTFLVRELAQAFPSDAILAEESQDDLARLVKPRVWLVDPLDGTVEFIAHSDDFCILIGLLQDSVPVMGAIYLPVTGVAYGAQLGHGAFVETLGERDPLHVSTTSAMRELRPVVSRAHHSSLVDVVIHELGAQGSLVAGSLGYRSSIVARGEGDFCIQPSALPKEWDTCAPEIILREAGGALTDCWNRPLRYNQRDVRRRFGVLASNGVCHAEVARALSQALDAAGIDREFGFEDPAK